MQIIYTALRSARGSHDGPQGANTNQGVLNPGGGISLPSLYRPDKSPMTIDIYFWKLQCHDTPHPLGPLSRGISSPSLYQADKSPMTINVSFWNTLMTHPALLNPGWEISSPSLYQPGKPQMTIDIYYWKLEFHDIPPLSGLFNSSSFIGFSSFLIYMT